MASPEQIIDELTRRTEIRPCPEIVWQKLVCPNPEYAIFDERHTGKEFAIVSGSETLGSGSGVGVRYTLDFKPVALATAVVKVFVGAVLLQLLIGGGSEEDIAGFRDMDIVDPETQEELLSPIVSASINHNTGEIITEWDRTSLIGDRFVSVDYEFIQTGCVKPLDEAVYHTGRTPYDLENPMEWGFILTSGLRAGSTISTEIKLQVYKDGVAKFLFSTNDSSIVETALNSLLEAVQEIENQELFDHLTTDSPDGIGDLIISTTDSVITPLTPNDDDFKSTCSLEDYYEFG